MDRHKKLLKLGVGCHKQGKIYRRRILWMVPNIYYWGSWSYLHNTSNVFTELGILHAVHRGRVAGRVIVHTMYMYAVVRDHTKRSPRAQKPKTLRELRNHFLEAWLLPACSFFSIFFSFYFNLWVSKGFLKQISLLWVEKFQWWLKNLVPKLGCLCLKVANFRNFFTLAQISKKRVQIKLLSTICLDG